MALPEPTGPLWTEVKTIYDPWPPDSEDVASQLSQAWQQGADAAAHAGERAIGAGTATLAAWQSEAGELLHQHTKQFGEQVSQLQQGMREFGVAAERYAERLRSVKDTISSVVEGYQPYYDLLSNPAFGAAGPAIRDWLVRNVATRLQELVTGAAGQLGLQLSGNGPNADIEKSGPKDGKLGEIKAFAELFKVGAKSQDGKFKAESNLGAELAGSIALNNEGLKAQLEASAGLKASAEYNDRFGPGGLFGAGGKGEVFGGAKASGSLTVSPGDLDASAEAFAGAKAGARGQADVGGIGLGLTAEGWAGAGAAASAKFGLGDDGKFHVGLSAGASLGLGGKLGVDLAVDPAKVAETATQVRQAVSDGADTVGRGIQEVGENVNRGIESARQGVEDFGQDLQEGIRNLGRPFKL